MSSRSMASDNACLTRGLSSGGRFEFTASTYCPAKSADSTLVGMVPHLLHLIRRQLRDHVDLALEQRGHAGGRFGDGPEDEPVEVHAAAPVVGHGVEHQLVVLAPGNE